MSFNLNFLNSAPKNFKATGILVLTLMPYHFLALSVFENNIPLNNIPIITATCFCLSLTWVLLNYATLSITSILFITIELDLKVTIEDIIANGGIFSIFNISLAFIFSYWLSFSFKHFIFTAYILLLLRIIFDFYCKFKASRKNKKTCTKDTIE